MAAIGTSIILYTALQSLQPCEKVFVDTAKQANTHFKAEEESYLAEFAKASCATSNPDILWLLALQETNFRFVIVRENKGDTFKISQGSDAVRVLKNLKTQSARNVDIGVMQFNWRWHGENFDNDPMAVLSPTRQVKYFIDKYSRYIHDRCDAAWVGCYHNQTDQALSTNYQKSITKKTVKLASAALDFLRIQRGRLNGELLGTLKPITVSEFRKVFASVRSFPKPEKRYSDQLLAQDNEELF